MKRRPRTRGLVDGESPSKIVAVIGANLRRLRTRRGLTLARLAALSGVSRTMISQIELGQSAPTINVLSRIVNALGLRFATLMGAWSAASPVVVMRAEGASHAGQPGDVLIVRPLTPPDRGHRAELHELRLAGHGHATPALQPAGVHHTLTLADGVVEIEADGEVHRLERGDTILLEADKPHAYRNLTAVTALLYLVASRARAAPTSRPPTDGPSSR